MGRKNWIRGERGSERGGVEAHAETSRALLLARLKKPTLTSPGGNFSN